MKKTTNTKEELIKENLKLQKHIDKLKKSEGKLLSLNKDLTDLNTQYKNILEETIDVFYLTDFKGFFTYINPPVKNLIGFTAEEILGRHFTDFVSEQWKDQVVSFYADMFNKRIPESTFEFPIVTKDKKTKWVEQTLKMLKEGDWITGFQGTARDISAKKKAQEALRESDERYRALFERSLDAVYICDFSGQLIDANQAALELLGYGKEEIKSLNFSKLLGKDQLEKAIKNMQLIIETGIHQGIDEFFLKRKDGSSIWIEANASLIYNNGEPSAIQGIARDITERKKIYQAIKDSEEQYRQLAQTIPDIIYEIDKNGNFTFINNAVNILGYTPDELLGKHFSEIIHPDYHEKVSSKYILPKYYGKKTGDQGSPGLFDERRTRDRATRNLEIILLPKGGIDPNPGRIFKGNVYAEGKWGSEILYGEIHSSGKWNKKITADNKIHLGTTGVIRDVTERKKIENRMLKIKDSAIELSINAIALADLKGIITYTNRQLTKLWGYSNEEIIGKNINILWTDSEKTGEALKVLLDKGGWIGELNAKKKDGSEFIAQISASMVADDYNNPLCIVASFIDISERARIENALRKREEKYRAIVDNINEFLFTVDRAGNILFTNAMVKRFTGYERFEIIGNNFSNFIHPDDRQLFIESSWQLLKSYDDNRKEKSRRMEFRIERKDKSIIWVEISHRPYVDFQDNVIGFTGMAKDITSRKDHEKMLETAIKEKEALLKEIHHRVKNNMQVICSLLSLQANQIEDISTYDIFMKSHHRVYSMSLVHELLYQSEDMSRINFNNYLKSLSANLCQIYNINTSQIKFNMFIENNIDIGIDKAIPSGLIINELLTNSMKYAFNEHKTGEIAVSLRKNNGVIEIVVSDNGSGISGNRDLKESKTFGMELIRVLTKQLMGAIEIENNKGTSVRVTFPDEEC